MSVVRRVAKITMAGVSLLAIAGCSSSAFIPRSGPELTNLASQATENVGDGPHALSYVVVNIGPEVIARMPKVSEGGFGSLSGRGGRTMVRPGIGDIIGVTIYESGTGGLFTATDASGALRGNSGNSVELPQQVVDSRGMISVPYAGQIPVAGREISAIQETIVERLKSRAIEPQVIVSVKEQRATQASVVGDVNAPGVFPVLPSGNRILEHIARAGGIKFPAHETLVHLQRRGRSSQISFARLVTSPADNIPVQPGDVIYVSREARSFVAVGATGNNAKIEFDKPVMTLADGIGKAAGLLDERADAGSVYVYRFEPRSTLTRVGADLRGFEGHDLVPTLYNVSLSSPQGYFLAKQFAMRSDDLIYVANAASVDLVKFFRVIQSAVSPTRDILTSRRLYLEPISSGSNLTAIPVTQ